MVDNGILRFLQQQRFRHFHPHHTFPWNRYLKTSFAMGEGISYTTRVSYKECKDAGEDEGRHKFLNYLMAELTFTFPGSRQQQLLTGFITVPASSA